MPRVELRKSHHHQAKPRQRQLPAPDAGNGKNTMLFNETTFIGIDPTAGSSPMAYAAIDQDLRLIALDEGGLDEITAFVGGQKVAFVAVSSPRRPNQGLMKKEEIRNQLKPVPKPGRWLGYRVAEYQLQQRKIHIMRTCGEKQRCPNWIRTGFEVYRKLEALGCQDYPALDNQASGKIPSQMMEVYPHGIYTALLGLVPFPKNNLEGRLQRQLVLHNQGLDIPDPMRIFEEITRYRILKGTLPLEALYKAPQLDALAAAYTAWAAATAPEEVSIFGHPEEGQIVFPVKELNPKY